MAKKTGPVQLAGNMRPITWEAFKTLPTDLASEYYRKCKLLFQAYDAQIAEMMGVSRKTLENYLHKIGVTAIKISSNVQPDQASWMEFLAREREKPVQLQTMEIQAAEEMNEAKTEESLYALLNDMESCSVDLKNIAAALHVHNEMIEEIRIQGNAPMEHQLMNAKAVLAVTLRQVDALLDAMDTAIGVRYKEL